MKIILGTILILSSIKINAQTLKLDNNEQIEKIEKQLNSMNLGRSMEEGTKIKEITNLPFWEKDTLTEYEYSISDKIDNKLTTKIILYNANNNRIANWIYYSLIDCNKNVSNENISIIINQIKSVSGFQFPIRGIVYEDLRNSKGMYNNKTNKEIDGIQETYFFFDGISVSHKTIKITTYNFIKGKPQRIKNDSLILNMKESEIETAFTYGRICNIQREDYNKFLVFKKQKTIDLEGIKFLYIVREEYQKAMHSNRNNLISAWVYSNKGIE